MSDLQLEGPSAPYLEMLSEAAAADQTWHDVCDNIDDLYSDLEKLSGNRADRQFQLFWANIEVLKPTIYARPPTPVVSSRFKDRKDLPRRAADIVERALISDVEMDDLHDKLTLSRDDLVVNGRGAIWLKMRMRDGMEVPSAYHVDRKDFRMGPARNWGEVPWTACRTWNTRNEVEKRFKKAPEKALLDIQYQQQEIGGKRDGAKKAEIWELWHKEENRVVWVSPGVTDLLDEQEPWLKLTGFFPCPRPATGTLKRGTLIPVPDVIYYRDQLEEINELTCRMSKLCEALRMRGFYPAGQTDVAEAIESAMKMLDERAVLVPVSSLAAMGPGTKLSDTIVWLPVKEVAEVVQYLVEMRRQLIENVYEITGLSDIMRGATDANETATAQRLKSQYGSVRVQQRQGEMVRLARDVIRLKAEAMAENMPIESLLQMAQVDDLPTEQKLMEQAQPIVQQAQQAMMQALQAGDDQQGMQIQQQAQEQLDQIKQTVTVEKVAQLLKDQKLRPFILDVETDSTIEPDMQAEKELRVEFAGAMGPMLQQAMQAMQLAPQLGPFVAESIRFMASGFKVDRRMDEAIDELAEKLANYQPPPQGPQEDPQVAQAKMQAEQTKAEAAVAKGQADVQVAQLKLQSEQAKAQMSGLEQEQTGAETQKIRAETQKILQEIQLAPQEMRLDHEREQQKMQFDAQNAQADRQMQHQQMREDGARQDRQFSAESKREDKRMQFEAKQAVADGKRQDKQMQMKVRNEKSPDR